MNAEIKQLMDSLESEGNTNFQELTIDFFDRLENKTTNLISNDLPENFLKGKHVLYPFHFNETTFVQTIEISLEGYSSSDKVKFHWQSVSQNEVSTSTQRVDGNKCEVTLNEVIIGFGFTPPKKRFKNPKIKSVRVSGMTMGNFTDTTDKISRINTYKDKIITHCKDSIADLEKEKNSILELKANNASLAQDIESKDEKVIELNNLISSLSQQQDEQEASFVQQKADAEASLIQQKAESDAALTQQKAEGKTIIDELRSKETNLNVKIQNLDDSLDQKTNESTALNTAISEKKAELKKLKDDINQFPAEFRGFVTQGGKNVTTYKTFTYIPIVLILALTGFLFWGTADLSAKYNQIPNMDLYTMLGSRLPFALLAGGIIIACYKLSKFLIEEIMRINRQRLNLTRVSIIANDITDTSVNGLNFDESEIFELRTKLKMVTCAP